MTTDLNQAGLAYARSLIGQGKVDKTSPWDFTADDGNALLGASGSDWTTYAKVHLGEDKGESPKTKARYQYPVAKGGKVFRAGVIAAKQRASQQGETAVENAAAELLSKIDGDAGKSAAGGGIELKGASFEYKFLDGDGAPAGTFEGYGAVFNNEDDGGDALNPKVFEKSLAQYGATGGMPKMLLNHGGLQNPLGPNPDDLIPIGKWSGIAPDTNGLGGKGRLINLDTERGKSIYGAMKEGALDGMSIAYKARDVTMGKKAGEPRRTINSADLLEMGPVTFPMNRLATIDSVKTLSDVRAAFSFGLTATTDLRGLEAALREEGLSRGDAVKAIAAFKTFLQRDAGEPEQELRDAATSDDLRALVARIRG
jgi:hypothetical protein